MPIVDTDASAYATKDKPNQAASQWATMTRAVCFQEEVTFKMIVMAYTIKKLACVVHRP